MNKLFEQVQIKKHRKNVFDLSHEKKLSIKMGVLYPVLCQEVVPNDKFRVNTELFLRMAPMVAPVMHRVNVYMHYFFVPNRILYDSWESFITGGVTGTEIPPFPTIPIRDETKTNFVLGSLADYFGIPPVEQVGTLTSITPINALPFRAYQMIYNEYYRDQTLTPAVPNPTTDVVSGSDIQHLCQIRTRSWEKDYFTSALNSVQRGSDVLLPIQSDVTYRAHAQTSDAVAGQAYISTGLGSDPTHKVISGGSNTGDGVSIENIENIDNQVSINDLRRSNALQKFLEKTARGGSRYTEVLRSFFNIKNPSDARLQRPEYLGGGRQPITISEVLANFGSTEIPQGNMAGHGISVGNQNKFTRWFEEHGYIIGIMSVLPRTCYSQGIPRLFGKSDKYDFFWPEFAHLGEQPVLNAEIYFDPMDNLNGEPFGYQSRYAEYKFNNDTIHGDFRDSLAHWHLARIFDARPGLNVSFIEADPSKRIFAVTDENVDDMYVQLYHNIKAVRLMPQFGTPAL